MRVHLRPRRDEQGAVAVLVALLVSMLMVLSGFAIDFGAAYTSKRQLQNAADAGALAAARVFSAKPGTCAALIGNAALKAQARTAAVNTAEANRAGHSTVQFDPHCLTTGKYKGSLEVTYEASGATTSFFGPLAGASSSITTARNASAVVYVPGTKRKLRPYGLCDLDVPPAASLPSAIKEIKMPGQSWSGSDCPNAQKGGNWWFNTCPGESGSGMSPPEVAAAIRNGCANDAAVVTPQDPSTPAKLSASLTKNCSGQSDVSPSCLDADTGNSSLSNPAVETAWKDILGQTILLPVFCSTPSVCNPSTVSGTGTNRVYPVYKLAPVVVCGYHMYDVGSAVTSTGDCAGNTFTSTYASLLGCSNKNDKCISGRDKDDNPEMQAPKDTIRLFLKFVQETAGETVINCDLGTACDAGARQVAVSR